jgi:glycosyltransferase involved in cell wall biosynthesis
MNINKRNNKDFAKSFESINISVVIPVYNEEDNVTILYEKLREALDPVNKKYEIIFVDDGSIDNTWGKIEELKTRFSNLKGINLRRNYGQTNAMVAGFDQASGEIIVTMDGDLQNDPSDIPMLLNKIEEGYDIVSGWRKERKDNILRVIPSNVANYIISKTTGVHLRDYGCSLKAYRSECIKSIKAYGEMHRFFPALASMTGARVTEIPVNHYPRKFGVSKYGFDRIFKVFSDIFSMNLIIRFSTMPLKGFAICAIPFILFTLFFGVLGLSAVIFNWTPGKALFFLSATGLSGMAVLHLLLLGVIGELVVNTSDLSHTQMPEITKKQILTNSY